ncbi:hypothetical protein BC937DRAFT_88168 [Endogone sp. FLAS-F59071]|nr:hypothetical protein BC937DRAFT_88168 [Endogone sp. FLAS-F59071]|eukprot:RUS18917.1 hypothetical protein BC937DRAFT_88168 [Endogone sp. FLAS-F59071]
MMVLVAPRLPLKSVVDTGANTTHNTTDDHEAHGHGKRANDQGWATAPPVDIKDGGDGGDDVNYSSILSCDTGLVEEIHNVEHDDVHAGKLLPGLERNTEEDTLEDGGLEQFSVAVGGLLALETDGLNDFGVFLFDVLVVGVAIAVEISENTKCLLVLVLVGEPARGFGEPDHADEKDKAGNTLNTVGNAEGGGIWEVGAAILDPEGDEDTPGDGPLLDGHKATTDFLGSDLGLIQRNAHGGQPDAQTSHNSSGDEHPSAGGKGLDEGANSEEQAGAGNGPLTAESIGNETRRQASCEAPNRHTAVDGTLLGGIRIVEELPIL